MLESEENIFELSSEESHSQFSEMLTKLIADILATRERCMAIAQKFAFLKGIAPNINQLPLLLKMYLAIEQTDDLVDILSADPKGLRMQISKQVNEVMKDANLDAIDAFGMRFRPKIRDTYNVKTEDKPTAIAWLKKHPEGAALVSEQYHPKSFEGFMKSLVESGGQIPEFVKTFPVVTLSVTKG